MLLSAVRRAPRSTPAALLSRLQHTLTELPEDWRVLKVPQLEVMDTSELKSMQELLAKERVAAEEQFAIGKAEQRKVLKVNAQLTIRKIDKIQGWIELVLKNPQREW